VSPEAALEAAILEQLNASEAVRERLGDPVRLAGTNGGLPAYPCLEIVGHEVRPAGSDGVAAREHRLDLAVVTHVDAPGGARAPLAAVRTALDGVRPQMDGWRCVLLHIVFADVLGGRRQREVRGLLRLRMIVEEV
jgi:hypothetical protein